MIIRLAVIAACAAAISAGSVATAKAATSPAMQACSKEWKDDKAAGTVPSGVTWSKFWSECSKRQAATESSASPAAAPAAAPAATTPEAAAPATKPAKPAKTAASSAAAAGSTTGAARTPTAAQLAEHQRIKECGTQWKAAKAANQIPAGQTWPQYWSACNTRLKAAGG